MYKKCKVVMLATNSIAAFELNKATNKLDEFIGFANDINDYIPNHKRAFKEFQHLYILSDDEIKEDDWMISTRDITFEEVGIDKEGIWIKKNTIDKCIVTEGNRAQWMKIIATTNSSLVIKDILSIVQRKGLTNHYPTEKNLPSIPQSFIDKYVSEYNKGNKIEEVMVEYSSYNDFDDTALCINSDNTINIKFIKDSWTREEVINKIREFRTDILNAVYSKGEVANNFTNNWIKNNL